MKTRIDEIKEIAQNAGMYIVSYGNKIFLNYQEMGLAWINTEPEPRLFTVTGYNCNIETDLEEIRQQLNEVVMKFKEYTVLKMKARIENDFE